MIFHYVGYRTLLPHLPFVFRIIMKNWKASVARANENVKTYSRALVEKYRVTEMVIRYVARGENFYLRFLRFSGKEITLPRIRARVSRVSI